MLVPDDARDVAEGVLLASRRPPGRSILPTLLLQRVRARLGAQRVCKRLHVLCVLSFTYFTASSREAGSATYAEALVSFFFFGGSEFARGWERKVFVKPGTYSWKGVILKP